ncbi:MAG: carbohydrate ABC transporter substrate-binding protein [Clostridia bacterium]|nr:carbohydrate ABC transporter substrate-binding protein [Clostridia bacterium]
MKKVLSLVLALALVLGCMSFAAAEDKIDIVVWSFTNELQGMVEKYYAPNHPEINFIYDMTPTADYPAKVDSLMASAGASAEAPDVFALEAAFVKKYVSSDWTADLKDLGFTDEELAVAIPVMAQIGQNAAGVQKGLSWQSTPGALFYRASLAEKYLGITDPEAFQEKVCDWDTFMETAAEVYEASEGQCKIVTGTGDIWNAYQYQRSEGWVVDGKLVIDSELYDYLDLCKTLIGDDLSWDAAAWGETWFAGMKGVNETLCFFLPTWGLHYTLKPNCGLTTNDTMSEEELVAAVEADGGTYGDWRMVEGPCGYSWGGTWIGANAQKVASYDDAKKAAVHDLIYFFTLDDGFLYQYAQDSGDFVGSTVVVDKIVAEGGTPNPFLGGQDHYGMFAKAAALANGSLMTEYDDTINTLWGDNVTAPYSKGEADLDTCIANFKAAVAAAFTNIVVE